ncbi:MAG: 4'-phosphopantetheinyl transferase superfamily protein [Mogibacterium sp.]|nr:4'-phosphopantetheinyl transferase superfamily protein [Mogibacterium sp.]
MKIYYSQTYGAGRGESRRLLETAIAVHTGDEKLAHDLVGAVGTTGEFGKPVIDGFEEFSVSHSGRTWAVLISEEVCGLDVQYRRGSRKRIAERFFDPADTEHIRQKEECSGTEAAEREFFRLWTRREALVKAVGGSAAASDVPSVKDRAVVFRDILWTVEDIEFPDYSADDGLHAAVCLAGQHEGIQHDIEFVELDRS